MTTTAEPLSAVMLRALRNLIANDSYAMRFQSMGQYRTALLHHFDDLVDAPVSGNSQCPALQPQAAIVMLDGDQQTAAQVAALARPGDT
ncbi:hypothetical protein [Massilia alkalitolerans]|uniref:hypothetical protein n=1 Tax=Massilia alkalitolerans TaxID=286638 RepID=UPI0004805269|nr:hypothetical protein [Massilia alkalitolerans]